MSYRKHSVSKGTRRAHHRRESARRRKLREKGGQVEPFGYADIRGRTKAQLRVMSVTKGARDGAPRLIASAGEAFGQDRATGLDAKHEHATGAAGDAQKEPDNGQ